jgi:hypothetical protein
MTRTRNWDFVPNQGIGIVRISSSTRAEIASFFDELEAERPGEIEDINLHDARNGHKVVVFKFLMNDYNAFFHRTTDKLKRRFGNDLLGWDISNGVFAPTKASA